MSKVAKRGSYRDHLSALRDLKEDGVLFLCGTSELLLSRAHDRVRKDATRAGLPTVTVEAQAVNDAMIMQIGAQGSLFEAASLYIIRRVEQAKGLPKFLKALPAKGLANRVVFVYRGEGAPTPLKTELGRLKARTVPCFEPWPNEVPDVVAGFAADAGLKLKGDALRLLLEMNGTDLVTHTHEISKLALVFAQTTTPLSAADIAPHLGLLREDDAYLLDRLLLQRQVAKAQALATQLAHRGEKGVALLGILAGHCRGVLKVSEALAKGLSPAEVASQVRMPPSVLKTYLQHLGGFGKADMHRYLDALELCRDADAQLKSSGIADELLIARVIDGLAAP